MNVKIEKGVLRRENAKKQALAEKLEKEFNIVQRDFDKAIDNYIPGSAKRVIREKKKKLFKTKGQLEAVKAYQSVLKSFSTKSSEDGKFYILSKSEFIFEASTNEKQVIHLLKSEVAQVASIEDDMKEIFRKTKINAKKLKGSHMLKALKFIKSNAKNYNESDVQLKILINALRDNGIGTISTSVEENYLVLNLLGNKKIKCPREFKLKNQLSKVFFDCLKMKDFAYLERFLNNNLIDNRLHQKMSKKNNELGTYFLPLKGLIVTDKGFYIVMGEDKYKQPLMVDWDGEILKKKQGKEIKTFGVIS
jgi:hypothetical protein